MIFLKIASYFYRVIKRRTAIFILASFIIVVTAILQLYSYKEHAQNRHLQRVGDYDYRPGGFLAGTQPSKNTTFCHFNYDLPGPMSWSKLKMCPTPETRAWGSYSVIYNAIQGTAYANYSKYDTVTYATQATPEMLYHIVEIARYWDGPISLAVFVPDYDMDVTMQIMSHLCRCYSGMSKVSLHLFFPTKHVPFIRTRKPEVTTADNTEKMIEDERNRTLAELKRKRENLKTFANKTRAEYVAMVREKKAQQMLKYWRMQRKEDPYVQHFPDCAGPDITIDSYRKKNHILYPINVGRNVARNGSTTVYVIVSDIEMVPSDGLATKFMAMLTKLMGINKREEGCVFTKTVFVVPLFEVEKGEEIPRDKETLVRLVAANRASYFHQKTCSHCQRFPGLQSWLARPPPDSLEPMLIGKREYPYHRWEPLYFGTRKDPWYSESLTWEGRQDKMTQMAELCLLEYRFLVLDGGFLCHAASSRPAARRSRPERANARHYAAILKHLRGKYKDRPQCKLD